MIRRFLFVILLLGLALKVQAQVVYDYQKEEIGALPARVNEQVAGRNRTCTNCTESQPVQVQKSVPKCSRITDDFCKALWSQERFGNMKVKDGELQLGYTASENSMVTNQYYQDLVNSRNRLPADLRKKTDSILDKLAKLMAAESSSRDWNRAVSKLITAFNDAVEETKNERVEKARPDLKTKFYMTLAEKNLYKTAEYNLNAEILEAKFRNNPLWQNIEKLYGTVKQDLIQTINEMNISDDEKKVRIEKVKSVQLTLPYKDPMRADAKDDCGTTESNAYYSPTLNVFTFCAGYINGLRSNATLYTVIAHEISHAIDSNTVAFERAVKSPLSNFLKPIINMSSDKSVIACDKWSGFISGLNNKGELNPKATILTGGEDVDALQPFYDCLAPKTGLRETNQAALKNIAENNSVEEMSDIASKDFLYLFTPDVPGQSGRVPNEFYKRPDLFTSYGMPKKRFFAADIETFAQSYACQSEGTQEERVKKSFEQLKIVNQAQTYDRLRFCKNNCQALANTGYSRPSGEQFADWMAHRAFGFHLKRLKSVEERREAIASAKAQHCGEPNVETENPSLLAVGREYSILPHPAGRARRFSIFNEDNASLVECEPDFKGNFGACKP